MDQRELGLAKGANGGSLLHHPVKGLKLIIVRKFKLHDFINQRLKNIPSKQSSNYMILLNQRLKNLPSKYYFLGSSPYFFFKAAILAFFFSATSLKTTWCASICLATSSENLRQNK